MRAWILLVALPAAANVEPAPAAKQLLQKAVCVADLSLRPGAFEPWHVYKYLKANTAGFVQTAPKDIMGGQTLTILHADIPAMASQFQCVHEDNEWKARVRTQFLPNNIFTLERDNGISVVPDHPKAPHIVSQCLLQDISLYRTMDGELGMRFDYGHCTLPQSSKKQAFIMVGLKKVPDTVPVTSTPNVRGFFEGVCEKVRGSVDEPFDLNKVKMASTHESANACFWGSADMEVMQPLDTQKASPCFNEAVAYTPFDRNNQFPTVPIRESDFLILLSKLPVGSHGHVSDDPHAPANQVKKMFGTVIMDRVCVKLGGFKCDTKCGKWCNTTDIKSAPVAPIVSPPPYVPPPICIDCEMHESLYAIFATLIVVAMTYYSYISTTLAAVATWFYVPLPGEPHKGFEELGEQHMPAHDVVNKTIGFEARVSLFFVTGLWSIFSYYFINLLDWCICEILGWEQCIRVFGFQYYFNTAYYNHVNGTAHEQHLMALHDNYRGRWIWHTSPELNIDVCPFRLWGMILITWFSACALFIWWRQEQKLTIMKTIVTQTVISEEEGFGQSNARMGIGHGGGGAGMLTKTLAFLGGGVVPP